MKQVECEYSQKQLVWIAKATLALHSAYETGIVSNDIGGAKLKLILYFAEVADIPASLRKISALSGISLASTGSTIRVLLDVGLIKKVGRYYRLL